VLLRIDHGGEHAGLDDIAHVMFDRLESAGPDD